MKAKPIPIDWHPALSIHACEPYLRTVGSDYGWLGGFDAFGSLRCVLPYTVVCKAFLAMVRFRVATIPIGGDLGIEEEKAFLESAVAYFRSTGVDMIIPATANTIFRTYPEGADAAPYGTYVIDLTQTEEALWANLHSKHRNVIRNAVKKRVIIHEGREYLDVVYELVRDTLRRSRMGFLSTRAFKEMVDALGENVKLLVAEQGGVIQSCAVIPFSTHGAYYVYGGGIANPLTGAMNLLQWEALRRFRSLGVERYDFVGVRIGPEKGTKQEGLAMFKERFGGQLVRGYMWKYAFNPLKYRLYCAAARLRSGGDIVDKERHKLAAGKPLAAELQTDRTAHQTEKFSRDIHD